MFFRKLTGDRRVVAVFESTISVARPPIMEPMRNYDGGTRPGRPRRRGRWWLFAAAVLAAPGAGLVLLRLVPWDIGTPWVQLLSVFPASLAATTAGLACAVAALWLHPGTRRAFCAALVAGVLAIQLGAVLDRVLPPGGTSAAARSTAAAGAGAAPGGQQLTVMAVNVGSTGIAPDVLVAEARNRSVDILALPELAPAGLEELDAAGLGDLLPARALDVDWAGTGSALFSRFPLDQSERVHGSVFYQTRAVATVPAASAPVHLTAVHVDSPRPGHTPFWRSELRQLGGLWRDVPAGRQAIFLGDFNASADHREFRELLGTGLTDAAQATGKALAPTWPVNAAVPAFVAVDHVLVSPGITVTDFQVVALPGTDHAAVVARLVVP
ncbi:MAG: endonuclease/exonuclease/phosphatase family protein [Actinomycetes bacterium]